MTEAAQPANLQEMIDSSASFVDLLYANRKGSVVRDAVQRQPADQVSPEFTNWRDEQRAWRETVALYDQSFHMTTTIVRGKEALPFFESVGINGFKTFAPERARHFVCCSPSGHVIGDGVLYCETLEEIHLVGRAAGHNWIQHQAEVGGWDVTLERDEILSSNASGRRTVYRYQVEGPHAFALLEDLTGEPLPETRPFQIITLTIAGHQVSALRHTMAGGPGYELYGPWDEGAAVKQAIIEAGEKHGLRRVGSMAYFTTAVELGWIPRPVPAIYSGEETAAFRKWLPTGSDETIWSLGGSFHSEDIEDYYFTPWELGYGHLIKYNHEFVGRAALEAAEGNKHRQKVTLVWNAEDLGKAYASYVTPGEEPARFIDLPRANYATWQYDAVKDADGNTVGVANYTCLSWNERSMLSLAVVEPELAVPGTELTLVWGEPDGGAKSKPWLEPHRQIEIRAVVAGPQD